MLFDQQAVFGVEPARRVPREQLFGSVMSRITWMNEIGHEAFP